MEFLSKQRVKNLLKEYKISPLKGLGQNFLVDRGAMKKILEAAELQPDDIVLEIGPGIGNLTIDLAKQAKKVIAVEKDQNLARILADELKIMAVENVQVIQADILKILDSKFIIHNSYKIVANLPYYITSPIIRKFLEIENPPKLMVLLVQKEVAQRICAKVPDMNLLSVSVQFFAKTKIISYISKESFWPKPKVDSAILRIAPQINTAQKLISPDFFKVVKAGFSQPRKQLLNNLSKKLAGNKESIKSWLLKNGVQPEQRAETLTIENWINLAKSIKII